MKKREMSPNARRPYGAIVAFALCGLLTVMTAVNSYLTKVPGFWVAVERARTFAQEHFGFFTFVVSLAGMVLAWAFSRVPEISVAAFKVKNPLHQASSDKDRLEFERQKRNWESEREELLRKARANDKLRAEINQLKQQLRLSIAEQESAAASLDIYEFALKTCSHQDSVLEKLFVAFDAEDAHFDAVYRQTMNWLAHVAKQLVVLQHRTLTCTIMSYDSNTDQCHIVGEVGTSPNRTSRFSPKLGVGIGGTVLTSGEPIVAGNVLKDTRYLPSTKDDPRSLMCIPVFNERKIVGLVNIRSRPENAFGDTDLKTVQPAIDNIAIAMALAKLRWVQKRQPALTKRLDSYLQGSTATGGDDSDISQKDGAGCR
jgi:putative methionine-R-sulfoxide reductase with GAF domain